MISFERQNMQTQQSLPSYRIELYFHDYKVAIEIDENGHSDRKIDYKIKDKKKQKKNFVVGLLELILARRLWYFQRKLSIKYVAHEMVN